MAWVRWSKVCVSKKRGGLGIRNLELFNLALLGKWKWRILVEPDSQWCILLNCLYKDEGILRPKQASVWWKDIQKIDESSIVNVGWFNDGIKKKVGDGRSTYFWNEEWCGPGKLRDIFPNLYMIAADKWCSVEEAVGGAGCSRRWRLGWSRALEIAEQAELLLLENMLLSCDLAADTADNWVWIRDKSKIYNVKSAYTFMSLQDIEAEVDEDKCEVLNLMWKSAAPSKFLTFSWRLLVGGLPTRVELQRRGVLGQEQSTMCVFCEEEEEDAAHLFFRCEVADSVWRRIYSWCGVDYHSCACSWEHFWCNEVELNHKKRKKMSSLFWIATLWVLWINRNNIIFRGAKVNINSMVQKIKCLVWGWFRHKVDVNSTISLENWYNSTLTNLFLDANSA